MAAANLQGRAIDLHEADLKANGGNPINAPYKLVHEGERYIARLQSINHPGEETKYEMVIERPAKEMHRFAITPMGKSE